MLNSPHCPICRYYMVLLTGIPFRDEAGNAQLDYPPKSYKYGCAACNVITIMPNTELAEPAAYTHLTHELQAFMTVCREGEPWQTIEVLQQDPFKIVFSNGRHFNPGPEYAATLRWAIAPDDLARKLNE